MKALDEIYYWLPKTINVMNRFKNKTIEEDTVIIAIHNKVLNITLPHPISVFIKRKYKMEGLAYPTQLKAAKVICNFLNFIYHNISDEVIGYESLIEKGINGLLLTHGAQYISHCTYLGNNFETVKYKESVLTNFYEFLKMQKVLNEDFTIVYRAVGKRGQQVPLSPFSSSILEVQRPMIENDIHKEKLKDFGENRYTLTKEFLEEAEGSGIELGIALQFFGGLRVGEVVNLTTDNVFQHGFRGNSGFWVQIKDNQNELFNHLAIKNHVQVKRPRNQAIIENKIVTNLYDSHMKSIMDPRN